MTYQDIPYETMQAGELPVIQLRPVMVDSLVNYPVVGVDVSEYQVSMNWDIAKNKAQFAFVRLGFGNNYNDPKAGAFCDGANDAGLEWGGYWCPNPGGDWKKAAASWTTAHKAHNGTLPPVVDIELDGGLPKETCAEWYRKLVMQFEQNVGEEVIAYTSAGFLNAHFSMTNWLKLRLLWVAHYTSAAQPMLPAEWTAINQPRTWTIWQWSAGGNNKGAEYGAGSRDIDLNRFNGSVADFNKLFGTHISELPGEVPPVTPPPVTPPPAGETVKQFVVSSAYRNIRNAHNTTGATVGKVLRGSIVPYLDSERVEDWCKLGSFWIWKAANE